MAYGVGPNLVRDGLVLYLDAANPKSYPGSGTQWNDLTSGGNHGTLVNGVGYTGDNGGAMVFDGVDDFANINNSNIWAFGLNGTINTWVYFTGNINTNHRLWCVNNNQISIDAYLDSSTGRLGLHGATTLTSTLIPRDEWVYISVVYNSGDISVYFNNIIQPLIGKTNNYEITNNNELFIGRFSGSNNGFRWRGKMAGFQIYNRGLSNTEIQQTFNSTRGRFGL